MTYGVYQDENVLGMVKYIREDKVPNDNEMLEFAEKMTYHLDDRLCPFSREELRAYAFLEGMDFAKRNCEKHVIEKPIPIDSCDTMTVSDFCKRFSHNNEIYVENKDRKEMGYRYNELSEIKYGMIMDWELKYTNIADCKLLRISNVIRPGESQGITFVVDTVEENFEYSKEKTTIGNSPLWLFEKVNGTKIMVGVSNGCE